MNEFHKNVTISIRILCLAAGWAITTPVAANCHSSLPWSEAPTRNVKTYLGYRQEQPGHFASENLFPPYDSAHFPIPLPPEMLTKDGLGDLETATDATISFYEPDGKGNWRICRWDSFFPERAADSPEQREANRQTSLRYAAQSALLRQAVSKQMISRARLFFYDEKGRLARIEGSDFRRPDAPITPLICRRYDTKDRITLLVNPKVTKRCTFEEPDLRDSWTRLKFAEHDGKPIQLLEENHIAAASGKWRKDIDLFRTSAAPDALSGSAKATSEKGVTTISGANFGKLDKNAANSVLDEFGRTNAAYFFTQAPVPMEVLDHPEMIYKYERRRQTYIEGRLLILYELFKPNEHVSRHRYYYLGRMYRNEQLDKNGKVVRIITVDDYRVPRPGPRPDVDDKLLPVKVPRLLGHQIHHRVYDIDARGKPKLVAVSWNREARLNPLKKDTPITWAKPLYGTPDGKVRWNSIEEFEMAFGFTSNAAEMFPDRVNSEEDE